MVIQNLKKIINKYQLLLVFTIIFILSLILHYQSLNYYFFQDDWFVLNWVRENNLGSFFTFRTDISYWRPLSMPLFYFFGKTLFGQNPFYYHVTALIVHLINSALIGIIMLKLFRAKTSAILCSFIYATSAVHFMSLSWLALTWNIIGNFFIFGSILFFQNYLEKGKKYLPHFFLFFLASLASTEFAMIIPALVIAISYFKMKTLKVSSYANILPTILPLLVVIFTYLVLRLFIYPAPLRGDYMLSFDLRIVNNFIWYILWLFNIPEVLKYHFNLSTLSLSSDVTFLNPFKPFSIPLLISFLVFTLSFLTLIIKNIKKTSPIVFILLVIVFTLSLFPILFFPIHSFPYYLSVPIISFVFLLGYLTQNDRVNIISINFILLSTIAISWFLSSFITIQFNRKTHWISGEQSISHKRVQEMVKEYPRTPEDQKIHILDANEQVKQTLMDQNAAKVIYNSNKLETVYTE